MYAGGFMSPKVLQRSGLSTICDILRHRRLSLFGRVARLDPGVPAHDALRLKVDIYKAERPAGEVRRVALATSGSTKFRRMQTLYYYIFCGDLRSPGVMERRSGSLGLPDDDDGDDDDG